MKTFEDIARDPAGTIYVDETIRGIRFLILRGPTSLCAYLGISPDHPIANFSYDDLPIEHVHGGFTFGRRGDGTFFPAGRVWFGWDYAHAGDRSFSDLQFGWGDPSDHAWTIEDVRKDSEETRFQFSKLLDFSEKLLSQHFRIAFK